MQHALTIAKLPGSDLAAIQFLDRSLEELGIIKVEAGAQYGNLFGRLLVKVATYMLKPGSAGPGFAKGVSAGVPAGVVTSGSLMPIFSKKLSAVTFDLAITSASLFCAHLHLCQSAILHRPNPIRPVFPSLPCCRVLFPAPWLLPGWRLDAP